MTNTQNPASMPPMIQSTRHSTKSLIGRLLSGYVLRYKKQLVLAVMCMVIAGAMTAANAYMMKPVLDDIFIEKNADMLLIIPLIILGIALLGSGTNFAHTLLMRYVGSRIIADMQMQLFAHLLSSDLKLFHDQSSGRLISRFTNDIQMLRNVTSMTLTAIVKEFITMVCLFGVMIWQSWELALMAVVAFPVAIYPLIKLGKKMRKLSDKTQDQLGEFTAQLDDIFQGVHTVKSYNRERYETTRATRTIEGLFTLYFKTARVAAAASPMMELVSGVVIAFVVGYGGMQVIDGTTSPGAFFSFIAAFIMAYRPVKALAGLNNALQEGMAAANRLFDVLDTEPTITDKPDAPTLALTQGDVQFEDVEFFYNQDGKGGANGLNLDIPAGKTVALVGQSGGGKSTAMKLLMRFYDVESGRITIDGQNIRDVTQHSLREVMAFVPQEPMLFDDTVAANIGYGKPDASMDEIIEAAKGAAAHDFIEELEAGYDTPIGPHGVRLSGGQRQRLAIARAMLKNAPILLLDEATSALDNESERLVQEALTTLMQGRTTLVIAHRLSTIQHADIIYVLEKGRVVESGNHDTLLTQGGSYEKLYRLHEQ